MVYVQETLGPKLTVDGLKCWCVEGDHRRGSNDEDKGTVVAVRHSVERRRVFSGVQ